MLETFAVTIHQRVHAGSGFLREKAAAHGTQYF